jgi:hypothetical protein
MREIAGEIGLNRIQVRGGGALRTSPAPAKTGNEGILDNQATHCEFLPDGSHRIRHRQQNRSAPLWVRENAPWDQPESLGYKRLKVVIPAQVSRTESWLQNPFLHLVAPVPRWNFHCPASADSESAILFADQFLQFFLHFTLDFQFFGSVFRDENLGVVQIGAATGQHCRESQQQTSGQNITAAVAVRFH